ncbi:MAG TPA: hypothetical protein VEG39_04965 [Clostridia bacterium]|nr:hypothetical protein [Clostridia bacterium]
MSNTMKTVVFLTSLFTFLLLFTLINFVIPFQAPSASAGTVLFAALLYIISYIAALYSQALIKYFYIRNMMRDLNIFKTFPARSFEIRDRIILLILPIIAVLMPMVSKRAVTRESLWSLAGLAALAITLEVLFFINNRTMKIHVTSKGFAISGIDFRLELSVPFSYTNAVGWYPFERIENHLVYNGKVLLYPSYDMGVITIECSEEEAKQIKALLVSNRVPERRYE